MAIIYGNFVTKRIQFRKDTLEEWTKNNPVLHSAEPAYITDTRQFKIGDGETPFNGLPAIASSEIFPYFVREANGTYEQRPPVNLAPNITWFGQSDATEHPDFVEYDPATGEGDIWINIQIQ